MKDEVMKLFVANICSDFNDVLLVGLEENKEQLPYSIACINFLYELKEKGLSCSMNFFNQNMIDIIYNEMKKYLVK